MSTERDIESINASLKQVGEQLKSYNDQAQQDIKAHAKLSEETRAKVDELLTRQGELSANLQSAEQKLAQIEQGGVHGRGQGRGVTGDRGRRQRQGAGCGDVCVGQVAGDLEVHRLLVAEAEGQGFVDPRVLLQEIGQHHPGPDLQRVSAQRLAQGGLGLFVAAAGLQHQ